MATVVIGAGVAVIDEHVDFFERHAPKLNAAFHGGEITTTGDLEYDITKWFDDKRKLEDVDTGDDWKAMRREVLERKPYLDDLVLQNEKFQRRAKLEADAHLDVNHPCANLSIHELAPLIAQTTRVEQEFYSSVESSEQLTQEVTARMRKIDDERAEIKNRFSELNVHWHANGCK